MEIPDVRYARSGNVAIAYEVLGDGPIDLVYAPFMLSAVFTRYVPLVEDFYQRLAAFSRLILFDKRGTGASDRPGMPPTLEAQMDDVRAVLDDLGSERAVLFGTGHGGQMCALFAATYPERTTALILFNTWPKLPGTPEEHEAAVELVRETYGQRDTIERELRSQYPPAAVDETFLYWMTMAVRATASPAAAIDFERTLNDADITDVLPAIRVPTLVLMRRFEQDAAHPSIWGPDPGLEEEVSRLAAAIPGAKLALVPGQHTSAVVGDEVTDEVRRFLSVPLSRPVQDRVLATVLFTDIVRSTERLAELGDRRWRDLLAEHRSDVRRELRRFAGQELDTAGDGFFASFDGPARAIVCAQQIVVSARRLGLGVRAGLHTGECEREEDDLAGIAVHIGARIAGLAGPGEVLVSRTVKDLVAGSGLKFDDRGAQELKGVPGEIQVFAVR
ncbi:MAG: adenylate/guanylate cyclase domain-containing protein [Gaiellaceae bacterium]